MVSQDAVDLFLVLLVPALEPLGRPAVQLGSLLNKDRSVGCLLDQGMLEAILRLWPPASLPDQVEPLKLRKGIAQVSVPAGDALQQREAERPPEHRCSGQRVVAPRGQTVDPGED